MTTQEKFKKMLTDCGMFDDQAEKVIEAFKAEVDGMGAYQMTWHRPASEYPEAIYLVLRPKLHECALAWIDANAPKAWFRGMFAMAKGK